MKKCILIDRSRLSSKKTIDDGFYVKDIKEIEVDIKDLIDETIIKEAPFREPVPFYYNIVPSKYTGLKKLLGADLLHWSFVNYYKKPFIMVTSCCGAWNYKIMAKMATIFPSGNPKATFINKKHYVWSDALFYFLDEDMTRDYFMANVYENAYIFKKSFQFEGSDKTPTDEKERYDVALSFLNQLLNDYYITLEDAYILFGSQLNYEYVKGGYHFYQSGNSFHPHYEFCKHFLKLTNGAKLHKEKSPTYMWSVVNVPPLKCKNYDKYNKEMKKQMKKLNLKYISPL